MSSHRHNVRVLTATGLRTLSPGELPVALAALGDSECAVTWIHTEIGPTIIQALDDMGLDEVAVKSLWDGPERPRVEEFADHLYISLFSAENALGRRVVPPASVTGAAATGGTRASGATPASEPSDAQASEGGSTRAAETGSIRTSTPLVAEDAKPELPRLNELRLFMGPRWIISVGRLEDADHEVLADRVRRQVFARGRGVSFIAYHICEWLVETLQPALDSLDDRIDALEDRVVLAAEDTPMDDLFSLKRDLVDLRRRVAPLRDVMQRLGSHGVLYIDPESEVYFRDVHDDVMRAIELLDTYRDILSSALDLHLSSVSNRLNRVMKKLTVVATLFMPLSFIVGLFGTNFTHMPFGSYAWFIIMFALLILSIVVMILWSWRRT